MAITWEALDLAGPPIQGDAVEYQQLEDEFGQVKQRMIELDQEFDSIRLGSGWSFSGSAADQFAEQLKPVATAVELLPSITTQVETIFQNHRVKLQQLQEEAERALARAQTRWNRQQQAESSRSYHRREADRLNGQLECLEDESARPHIFGLWQYAMSCVSDADSNVQNSETALEGSRTEWNTLHTSEQQLDEETANSLRSVELWSLADPSNIERALDAVLDFLNSAWEGIKDLGEWIGSRTLMDLYEALDWVLIGLTVLAIGVAIFASGGIAMPLILAAVSLTKLMIGVELHSRGQISSGQLAGDALGFALSLVGLSANPRGALAIGVLGFELVRGIGGRLQHWHRERSEDWQVNSHRLSPVTIGDNESLRERSGLTSSGITRDTNISTIRVRSFNMEEIDFMSDVDFNRSIVSKSSHFKYSPPSVLFQSDVYSFRDSRPVIMTYALGD